LDNGRFSFAEVYELSEDYPPLCGGATMSEAEKAKTDKPETKATDEGHLSAPPRKEKIVEPVASRAAHYS
jgi:hypothetical protein